MRPPFLARQSLRRPVLSLAVVLTALAFSLALSVMDQVSTEMAQQVEAVYDNLEVTVSITNLTGTQSDHLDLPEWCISLFFYGESNGNNALSENNFTTYIRDVQAKTSVTGQVDGNPITLAGVTGSWIEANLAENGVIWRNDVNAESWDGADDLCIVPDTYGDDTVTITVGDDEDCSSVTLTVAGTYTDLSEGGTIYCSWETGLGLCETVYGYKKADSLCAVFTDNRKIDEFWDVWGSSFFVEPSKEGTPVLWESSPVYQYYPFSMAIYDDVLNATVEKLEQNQALMSAASLLLLAVAFGVGFVFNWLSLRSRNRELQLQYVMGVARGEIMLGVLLEQGVLGLAGIGLGLSGFIFVYRTLPTLWKPGAFWLVSLVGTALACAVTLRHCVSEVNLGGE